MEYTKDMDNVMLSPTTIAKLKNKNCANRIRHGSPKLQEVLREKCRLRMREKRGQLFNRSRFGLEINSRDIHGTLTELMRSELTNLASSNLDPDVNPFSPVINEPLTPEEALELETEILKDEEDWILQEYERISQEEIELLAMAADVEVDEVICPKCQKSTLIENQKQIACKSCDFQLNNSCTLKEVGHCINKSVNNHTLYCREPPGFLSLAENDTMSLYLVCDKCSTWAFVI